MVGTVEPQLPDTRRPDKNGSSPERINRIEKGKHVPSVATIEKLKRSLAKAAKT